MTINILKSEFKIEQIKTCQEIKIKYNKLEEILGVLFMKNILLIIVSFVCLVNLYAHPKLNLDNHHRLVQQTRIDSLHGFDVISYYIDIEIDDQDQSISGSVETVVVAEDNLEYVEYNLVGLDVSSVLVDGEATTFTHTGGIISIPVNVENNQQFTTNVFYSGNPQLSSDGYNIGMVFRTNMVFTISDPNATRNWFPCYDHPWDKAIISFNVTCRDDWVAACNGLQGETINNNDGTKSYEWIGENPMATYLAVIHLAPYLIIEQTFTKENGEVIPIQHFVQSNYYDACLVDFAQVPDMMQAYTDAYGEYPFEKYGQALVNMQTYGAMEHQTMTTLGVSYIDGSPDDPEYTVAHELSHHWFGDCLTPFTWKDVWLSEGFATYSEGVWANYLLGYDAMIEYVNINIQNYYKNWQNSAGPQTIYDPAYLDYFTPPTYEKAASVLHMLRLELGDATFWTMLQSWFANNQNGNVITEEFQAHCEDVSGLDLEQFFQQWIYSPGIPSYEYAVLRNPNTNQVKFYHNVTSDSGVDFYLTIPFYVGESPDSLRTQFTPGYSMSEPIEVNDINAEITLDPDNWNLIEAKNEISLTLNNVFAGNSQAILNWTSFPNEEAFLGYNVYMKAVSEAEWVLVNEEPIETNSYFVNGLENGVEYHFYVVITDAEGFESYPTDSFDMTVTPQLITPSQSILIVDDSADGIGALLSPSDEEIDNFYNNIFTGIEVSNIDLNEEELSYEVMSDYDVLIWHNDSVASSSFAVYESDLGNYLLSGGKLIVSGLKTILDISPDFAETFLGINSFELVNSPYLNTAVATNLMYSNLDSNSDLMPAIWDGHLSMITTFPNSEHSFYTTEDLSTSVAMHSTTESNWETYFFGFPLYYFQAQQVKNIIIAILSNTNPPVENDNNVEIANSELTIYPNPTSKTLKIKSDSKADESMNISLYNLRGQKVLNYNNMEMKSGYLELNIREKKLANGVYFIKISSNKRDELKKLLLLK